MSSKLTCLFEMANAYGARIFIVPHDLSEPPGCLEKTLPSPRECHSPALGPPGLSRCRMDGWMEQVPENGSN